MVQTPTLELNKKIILKLLQAAISGKGLLNNTEQTDTLRALKKNL